MEPVAKAGELAGIAHPLGELSASRKDRLDAVAGLIRCECPEDQSGVRERVQFGVEGRRAGVEDLFRTGDRPKDALRLILVAVDGKEGDADLVRLIDTLDVVDLDDRSQQRIVCGEVRRWDEDGAADRAQQRREGLEVVARLAARQREERRAVAADDGFFSILEHAGQDDVRRVLGVGRAEGLTRPARPGFRLSRDARSCFSCRRGRRCVVRAVSGVSPSSLLK